MIKALLLDFDGVLAYTFPYHFKAWKTVLGQHDIQPDGYTVRMHEGAPAYKIAMAIAKHYKQELPEITAKSLAVQKGKIFRQISRAKVYPSIPDIIKKTRGKGFKLGLVTGTSLENLHAVIPSELLNEFDCIVREGDTRQGKPFPDPYLKASEKLNIRTQDCLVIENAPLGIESAKNAGTKCVALMTTLEYKDLQKADVILKDHQALLEKLDELVTEK